jgi:hypothetical protein
VSSSAILVIYSVGAAALALWLVVRFPSLGPSRLTGALLMGLAALIGMRVAVAMIDPVAQRGSYGVVLALLLLILPALTWIFWSAAVMLRMLAAMRP